ncbi:MAG TPA: aminotransferase class III-fold pyridoxal phosphate-dependent enzyme [bacterium]|nr:aminotransferase class III-fold pyridoxal phosphate-dependent enzyme [bacterium]
MPEIQTPETELMQAYVETHPRSRKAFLRATEVLPGGLTHDTRALVPFLPYIERAQGARKWDLDGHEYVDYAMGHGALILGHAHPAIVEAVRRQIGLGTHHGANHVLEIEWAERIRDMVPGAELVRFTSSGTEATLLALRVARAVTGRSKLVKFRGHFHGWHDAVMPGQVPPWDELPQGVPASIARETIVLEPSAAAVEATLEGDPDVAAVIIEPGGASWGTVPLAPGFLQDLRRLTTKYRVPLIFDEVITGFRVAPGGVQQTSGVTADLVTLAKILAGGLPGGAVVGRRDLLAPIGLPGSNRKKVQHPGTYNANPLSAAAGIACLDLLRDGRAQAGCDRTAASLRANLNAVLARLGAHGAVYGTSSEFHLVFDPEITPGDPDSALALPPDLLKKQRGLQLFAPFTVAVLMRGAHVFAMGGFVSIAHGADEIARTTDAFEGALRQIQDMLPR